MSQNNRGHAISSDSPFSSIHDEVIVGGNGGAGSVSGNNFNVVNSEGED
jgi:hypothetical protein